MRYKNVFWGLLLIIIGGLFIGRNLHLIYFDWYNFIKLWPLIFIFWGISVLPLRDIYKIGILVIVLGGATWYIVKAPYSGRLSPFEYNFNFPEKHFDRDHFKGQQEINIPYNDSMQNATLKMETAAGRFYLDDTTNKLLYLKEMGRGNLFKYFLEESRNGTKINISEEGPHVYFFGSNNKVVNLKLNSRPVWNINLESGAAKLNFDLSRYKVSSLNLDGGAGSFDLKLGDLYPKTNVTIDAGASSITVRIPKSTGCDLRLDAVLTGRNISGFHKIGDKHYQSDNFDNAKNKVFINVSGAVINFNIERY